MVLAGIALPAIGLVVGAIVIMNIMLVAVAERTREIGIRKSLGARRRDILRQFIVEATTLSTVGAAIGVAVGLGLTYYTLCLFANRTAVTVDDRLRVEHGPLFWPGGVNLPADAVTAVYCEQVLTHGKRRGPSFSYAVKAVTADGRAVTLLTGQHTLPRAKFFERTLERWLGLSPTPVPGEAL